MRSSSVVLVLFLVTPGMILGFNLKSFLKNFIPAPISHSNANAISEILALQKQNTVDISALTVDISALSKQSAKTDLQIAKTDKQIAKTDNQMSELIKYNQNRDRELEEIIGEAFLDALTEAGWEIQRIAVRNIFKENGSLQSEWDSIFYATHSSIEFPRLFFVESKQILSVQKYSDARVRLSETKSFLEIIDFEDKTATGVKSFTKTKRIFRPFFTSALKKPKIELVVGSPVLESNVKIQLEADGVSCVTFPEDQYVVTLNGIN